MSSGEITLQPLHPNESGPATARSSASPHGRPRRTSTIGSKNHWKNAKKAYYLDRYRFKGFEMLHLLSIQYYERELCQMEWDICVHNGIAPAEEAEKLSKLRSLLKEYAKAIRALEKTIKHDERRPKHDFGRREVGPSDVLQSLTQEERDGFVLEQREYEMKPAIALDPVRKLLHIILQRTTKYGFHLATQKREVARVARHKRRAQRNHDEERVIAAADEDDLEHDEFSQRPGESAVVDLVGRLVMTFLAGGSVLVPMLIMTFRTSQTARLITVCVATLLFGVIVSFATRATNHEILAADAAYAAVLVVYIGTAGSTNNY